MVRQSTSLGDTNMLSNRPTKLRILALAICAALVLTWNVQSRWSEGNIKIEPSGVTDISLPPRPSCKHLPGAEDALIIFKTGSTELKDRLPIHLNTTLQCYPNYIIFSDFGERFDNEHIIDALEFVSTDIQSHHDDFKLWRRLQQGGRAIFETSELSGPDSEAIEAVGKPKNPGWKLDKWKFLPMVKRTLDNYPSMKWYVFVEADTYLLWASLLQYLAFLDHTQHYYIGSQTYIGDTLFAHGGTGFIVSQPAMRMVVARYNARQQEIESYTDAHWAGDCVLGKVFKDAGVKFTSAWPILQGDYPGLVPYARPDGRPIADSSMREWCYPVVSYHHMSPTDIRDMWNFEQEWLGSDRTVRKSLAYVAQNNSLTALTLSARVKSHFCATRTSSSSTSCPE